MALIICTVLKTGKNLRTAQVSSKLITMKTRLKNVQGLLIFTKKNYSAWKFVCRCVENVIKLVEPNIYFVV